MTVIEGQLLEFFLTYREQAVLLSILINVFIAIAGVIPSIFITGANIAFFGFWKGMAVSLAGEIIGAAAAFYLYRKGLKKPSAVISAKYPKIKKLLLTDGLEAFYLILLLRILPFVPSGIVTFAAAAGRVAFGIFTAASTLGKIPALFIEAFSVYQVIKLTSTGKILIEVSLIIIIFSLGRQIIRRRNN